MSEKYGITDAHYLCDSAIFNTETDEILRLYQICDLLNQQDQRIAELEEQLKNAIRFKTPQVERFAVVQYIHRKGKPYKIEHCYDTYKDENMNTVYCYYDCDSYNFHVIQICATKEEAQAKLEKLQGEKYGR